MSANKAVVLLSGGLDSATVLAIATQDFDCYSLSFDYGQCAHTELRAAEAVAHQLGVKEHRVAKIDLAVFGGSALTDHSIEVPCQQQSEESAISQQINSAFNSTIPVTYVPARNTIFLSYALAWAEVLNADAVFIGVNAVDYSGYPDCRPEYIEAFQAMANVATKRAVEGKPLSVCTPLIDLTKAQIIERGQALGVDYAQTISCYQANEQGAACGRCDSCYLRRQGFVQAKLNDPTLYQ